MTGLIERLEAASEGSRELDDEIATLVFTEKQRHCIKGLSDEAGGMWMFRYPNGSIGSSLRFTGSLDAAMTLLPENWCIASMEWWPMNSIKASLTLREVKQFDGDWAGSGFDETCGSAKAWGPTPVLALCIAAIRARSAS